MGSVLPDSHFPVTRLSRRNYAPALPLNFRIRRDPPGALDSALKRHLAHLLRLEFPIGIGKPPGPVRRDSAMVIVTKLIEIRLTSEFWQHATRALGEIVAEKCGRCSRPPLINGLES